MKIMRKGFTLVELLVVLTVIGILTSVATISGREMTNIANANKIVENFHIIGSAMNMYYSHNTDACNITATNKKDDQTAMTEATILTGLKAYLKSTTDIVSDSETEGKFLIKIHTDDNSWWLTYKIPASGQEQIARILENRALQEGFVNAEGADASVATNKYTATKTDGTFDNTKVLVYYQVR